MPAVTRYTLAAAGSTGNNTHTSVEVPPGYEQMAVEFVVEAVGATPTVTWKVQGSEDGPEIADASSNFWDLPYVTDASDTLSQATRVTTAVGDQIAWLDKPERFFRKFRLVTTANTNVTYHAYIDGHDTKAR